MRLLFLSPSACPFGITASPRLVRCIDGKFGVTNVFVQTAGSSNPNAGAEGQIMGVKNAEAFRARVFAARDGQTGVQAPLAPGSAPVYVSVPSAAHSMQLGSGSLELQQLQEINAGIKQASCPTICFSRLLTRRTVGGSATIPHRKAWRILRYCFLWGEAQRKIVR